MVGDLSYALGACGQMMNYCADLLLCYFANAGLEDQDTSCLMYDDRHMFVYE